MTTAMLFPGQGAQQVGMMADLAEASPAARKLFDLADAHLGMPLSELCFQGPEERLNATDISQPAIFVCSAAALAAVAEALGSDAPSPTVAAGLSLGEYTALYAADALDFLPALELVARRGRYMQAAAEARPGGMVCVIGLAEEKVLGLCAAATADGGELTPANFNCPGQIVVSGDADACARAVELASGHGATAAVPLKVAGAFHSSHMAPAAEQLAEALAEVPFRRPRWPVLSNVDACPHDDPGAIRARLVAQMTSPVRWADCVHSMLDNGVEAFYEIGPGRVLAGLMRRIDRRRRVVGVGSGEDLARLAGQRAGTN